MNLKYEKFKVTNREFRNNCVDNAPNNSNKVKNIPGIFEVVLGELNTYFEIEKS